MGRGRGVLEGCGFPPHHPGKNSDQHSDLGPTTHSPGLGSFWEERGQKER